MRHPIRLSALPPGVTAPLTPARRAPRGQTRRETSALEGLFWFYVRAAGLHHGCVAQYPFAAPERDYISDFAWPAQRVLVEIDGGIWTKSGHSTGRGILRDMDKANLAVLRDWRPFRFASEHIKSGEAIRVLAHALKGGEGHHGQEAEEVLGEGMR